MTLRKNESIRQYCNRNGIKLTGKLHRLEDERINGILYKVWIDEGKGDDVVEISITEDRQICICGSDWVF